MCLRSVAVKITSFVQSKFCVPFVSVPLNGLGLTIGFFIRTTCGYFVTEQPSVGSAVYNRLKLYLQKINADEGETPHSFRAGCSITLALLEGRKEDISRHVGWANTRMVDFYNDLRKPLSQALRQRLSPLVSLRN